jgi:signal transduction histidine kinase/predicted hydrocarbon binding protein
MGLKTVRVPAAMQAPFVEAERHVSRYFRDRKDDPQHGTIEIFGERYILVRAASLSVDFMALVERVYGDGRRGEADEFAKSVLFDLAHAVGKSDARNFHTKMGLVDPIAKLSAGPIHFAHAGWAFVDIFPESVAAPDDTFCLVYDHPYSFESDAWLRAGKRRDTPACIMNAGYSSGWCEESFGVKLVATEILCRAKGDPACRFLMARPDKLASFVERYLVQSSSASRSRVTTYSIPDFFSRQRVEEDLRKQLAQTQKLEAIGRLAGGIAHDFNNLMAVVLGSGGLLARKVGDDPALRPFVDSILQAGERAAKLTQQLLAFGRAQPLALVRLEVNDVVRDVSAILARVMPENVTLDLRLAEDAGFVRADRGQLEQVVMNLVVNARDAMPGGGAVTIATSREAVSEARSLEVGGVAPGDYVRIEVIDTGVGMDDATLAQIFEPFFTTKEPGKGTGLGLSTVYGIVKQAGGAIGVTSAPGEGARFVLHWPRVEAERDARASERDDEAQAARGETILVVEDQPSLRRVVREVLEELGYRVIDAGDVDSAMAAVAAHAGRIDLLLSDVLLPNGSGPDLAERVVASRPDVRVLFMSGYADDAVLQRVHGREVALLPKPFTPAALAKRVRGVLDAPRAARSG